MFYRRFYETVRSGSDDSLSSDDRPYVYCSALSASILQDRTQREYPVLFSSLASAILEERRERQRFASTILEERRERKGRRRHNAEVQTPERVAEKSNPDDLMEPLVPSMVLEQDVEMRTLLENRGGEEEGRRQEEGRREKERLRNRKRTALNLKKVSQSTSALYSKVGLVSLILQV